MSVNKAGYVVLTFVRFNQEFINQIFCIIKILNLMNKKVLTLCAAMLLGSSLTSIYAEGVSVKDFDNYKTGIVYVESTKTLTFNEDVTIDDYHNYLLISDDDVIVDGQNHALYGHIVVTGKNVTIKNLTVNYNNGFTEAEDGTLTVNKTAISVFSERRVLLFDIFHRYAVHARYGGNTMTPVMLNIVFHALLEK